MGNFLLGGIGSALAGGAMGALGGMEQVAGEERQLDAQMAIENRRAEKEKEIQQLRIDAEAVERQKDRTVQQGIAFHEEQGRNWRATLQTDEGSTDMAYKKAVFENLQREALDDTASRLGIDPNSLRGDSLDETISRLNNTIAQHQNQGDAEATKKAEKLTQIRDYLKSTWKKMIPLNRQSKIDRLSYYDPEQFFGKDAMAPAPAPADTIEQGDEAAAITNSAKPPPPAGFRLKGVRDAEG